MYFNNDTLVFLDGEFVKASEATCSLYAQSLHYGYAIFEGIRSYRTPAGTRIFKAREHYERLHFSCQAVGLPLSYTVDDLIRLTYSLLEQNNLEDAYIRPLVYAGTPNMGLTAPQKSNLLLAAWAWGKYLGDKTLRVMLSPYERPNPKAVPVEAKVAGHYVNSTIACSDAKAQGYDEALLLDMNGYVAEGPGANFFYEKDGELFTPPPGHILPGITRDTVIKLARDIGITVQEKRFTPDVLMQADAAFMTGTAAEVVGVQSINEHTFPKPYEESLGALLARRYTALVTGKLVPA